MGHEHSAGRAVDRGRLRWVLGFTAVVLAVELVGAWLAGSLALLADAGHLAADAGAVLLALAASYLALRAPDKHSTFGWHRAEVLAAAANAFVLLVVCGVLALTGVRRLLDPAPVDAPVMLLFAAVGLLANGASAAVLSRADRTSLNLRGAWLEVVGDLIGSALAVLAAVVIWTSGWARADAVAALLIAALIVPRALTLLRDSLAVLLERTPAGLDLDEVRIHLLGVDGVTDVHDLHAWTITSGLTSLSAHVGVSDRVLERRGVGSVLDELSTCVADHFAVRHATFQVEPAAHRHHEDLGDAGCA